MSEELLILLKRMQGNPKNGNLALAIRKGKVRSEPTREQAALLNRMATRDWLYLVECQLIEAILYLRGEVKFIEHLRGCWICRIELQLDVERYLGNRAKWYLCLENSEYLEEQYSDCPKERKYKIDNYWVQVERCRKGITESDANTLEFILDRAKWAYKIMGKQIKLSRLLLRMVRNWDFTDRAVDKFNRIYEEFQMYEIANP